MAFSIYFLFVGKESSGISAKVLFFPFLGDTMFSEAAHLSSGFKRKIGKMFRMVDGID